MTIDTLRYWLDNQVGVTPGWYVQAWGAGKFLCDSQKVWFPVDVDDFGPVEEEELVAALKDEFPDATIESA